MATRKTKPKTLAQKYRQGADTVIRTPGCPVCGCDCWYEEKNPETLRQNLKRVGNGENAPGMRCPLCGCEHCAHDEGLRPRWSRFTGMLTMRLHNLEVTP